MKCLHPLGIRQASLLQNWVDFLTTNFQVLQTGSGAANYYPESISGQPAATSDFIYGTYRPHNHHRSSSSYIFTIPESRNLHFFSRNFLCFVVLHKIFNPDKWCINLYCTSWFLAKVSQIHKPKKFQHKQKRIKIHN